MHAPCFLLCEGRARVCVCVCVYTTGSGCNWSAHFSGINRSKVVFLNPAGPRGWITLVQVIGRERAEKITSFPLLKPVNRTLENRRAVHICNRLKNWVLCNKEGERWGEGGIAETGCFESVQSYGFVVQVEIEPTTDSHTLYYRLGYRLPYYYT